ncbi:MAG: ATP-binding protein [Planctomycetota bacterium]|nr:ATP-binding protein [Planctomycetota bacterium]
MRSSELWLEESNCESCPVNIVYDQKKTVTIERTANFIDTQRFFLTSSPICDANRSVQQILVLIQDITPMKEMQAQLAQAGKIVAVGQLAAGIAHEISNPLAVVASSAEILCEATVDGARSSEVQEKSFARHLKKTEEGVFRCKAITIVLPGFPRREDDRAELVDVHELLREVVQLVEGSARSRDRTVLLTRGTVEEEAGGHGPGPRPTAGSGSVEPSDLTIYSRPRFIQQASLNLLLNALDATEPRGRLEIRCFRKDGRVEIAVKDTGCGIPAELLDRVFEPFFTTKAPGKGTGLGLYVTHQVIAALQGRISGRKRRLCSHAIR